MSIAGFPYPFVTGGPAYRSKVLVPSEEMDARNSREPDSHTNLIGSDSGSGSGFGAAAAPVMVKAAELGAPFLRLRGISSAHLPPSAGPQEELIPFLATLLRESVPFIDSVAPKSAKRPQPSTDLGTAKSEWKPLKTKSSKVDNDGSTTVSLYERTLSAPELRAIERSAGMATSNTDDSETWACRRSVHRDSNVPRDGSASWGEFVTCFKDKHVECEEAFTPSIVGTRMLRDYDVSGLQVDDEHGDRYGSFKMKVVEARHKIGVKPLLKDRAFTVLQVTCSLLPPGRGSAAGVGSKCEDSSEILVMNIPVSDVESLATTTTSSVEGKTGNKEDPFRKDAVKGSFVSVERIRKLPTTENDGQAQIEWIMATASDARGSLPGWVQTMAVPGQIAKDVTLFLGWVAKERENKGGLVA
ncbi:hypothetical protein SMACR_04357 [Sordaria macrospora]|uniref:WGS project CABT00000000 data, contig 2.19 n=2 Tax=Sordaria macrospora TaxID=5147 RepID=F7W1L5_SORMK|nr:uncharacterized protein SMAC_04357 [Sordaria macrospora k-hell]KAA8635775.1 hypothetical protein SMACR_04357 [Sordaria macrospora]KAH7626484.1 hypothetical protein B0T09DRAFT_43586 [Sordaria sp. MPI-SDFR-AT-0083]WPJ57967.1 hypothetical protein SMAC4_04357 [Sordaria macrospora]CCC04990.1 unnamed protein product [Sordaria macrospora k-hell]